ncbi:MAG TPA: hypothetical protein VJ957_01830 [Longimicrobiales bacterium]|nr:hypothetical protein [Longimicrobiales bacterium]
MPQSKTETESTNARQTPYEFVFGAETFEETLFPGIRDEIEERGSEPADPEQFIFLTSVGKLLRMIAGDAEPAAVAGSGREATRRAADAAEARDAADTAVREHGHLLFHAYNFWRRGRQLFLLEQDAVAAVLGTAVPEDVESVRAPHSAGYLQLPPHRFWARAAEGRQPEAVDGVFWTATHPHADARARLDLLLVLGMRPDRAGFSVVPVGAALGSGEDGWVADARPGGEDFANTLPGGELEDLVSLETRAEALKLMVLWFRYLEAHPEALGSVERNGPDARPASPHALPPSGLEYRRVRGVTG